MALTREQRDELRAKAEAATPGPWMLLPPAIIGENNHVITPHDGQRCGIVVNGATPENATYIAAANPATVLTLLDALEEAECEVARLEWRRARGWQGRRSAGRRRGRAAGGRGRATGLVARGLPPVTGCCKGSARKMPGRVQDSARSDGVRC